MNSKTIMQKLRSKMQSANSRCMNQRGVALVMVLILSVIALAVVSVMIYMVTQGTRFSGFNKRYETAREAGIGGAQIVGALIANRGNLVVASLINSPNSCVCDPDNPDNNKDSNGDRTCLCDKLCNPPYVGGVYKWTQPNCDTSLDPLSNPDMQFDLSGASSTYQVSAKIVDTTLGNSDLSGLQLGGTCVACGGGTIQVSPSPYLYRVEVNSRSTGTQERSKLSVLYAY